MKHMKDPLGVSPSKVNQGTTRGKEQILLTSFDFLLFFKTLCWSMRTVKIELCKSQRNDFVLAYQR